MASDAFILIRDSTRDPRLVFFVADAFHNLPAVVHSPRFRWSWLLNFLEGLEREYPAVGGQFLTAFDEVIGFRP